ncbi:hypothetical protein NHQ30_005985 [Ciborinia camelliae]|nr:hypothetical protein NHQ30_005985 [Ciborinia camelliae]
MKFTSSLLLLCGGLTASAAVIEKRTTGSFHLYAYGGKIGGLPIYYSDGNAFIGHKAPSGSSVNTNITFAQSSSSEWIITPTNRNITLSNSNSNSSSTTASSSNSSTSSPALFINPSSTSLTSVGFTGPATSTNASSYTTQGFISFGNWAMWKSPNTSKIASSFYAKPVAEGVWQLMWNENEIEDGESVGVAVRMMAPSAGSSS